MNFNLKFEKLNKKNYDRKHYGKILTVRLPCNPIFPVGAIYLADHLHKRFPKIDQQILDLAALPLIDVERVLLKTIKEFQPSVLVFSWRDIQIYAPVDGRGGNPLQNSFEFFYEKNQKVYLLKVLLQNINNTSHIRYF